MTSPDHSHPSGLPRGTIVACIVVSVIGFLIYTGHSAHLLGFFPYLVLLACPLLHVFMHGGHHHGEEGAHAHDKQQSDSATDKRPQGG